MQGLGNTPILMGGVASLLVTLGIGRWIPWTIDVYGRTYFGQPPWRPSMLRRWAAKALGLAVLGAVCRAFPAATWPFLAGLLVALAGVVAVDRRYQVIPDRFQLLGLGSAVAFTGTLHGSTRAALDALPGLACVAGLWAAGVLYARFRGRTPLGLGDLKLLAWLSIAFGPDVIFALVYAIFGAAILMIPLSLGRRHDLSRAFAFGPFIVAGLLLRLFETYFA